MRRKRLLWQLYPYHLLIIVLSLIAAAWYSSRSLRQFYIDRTRDELESKALLAEELLRDSMLDGSDAGTASLCRDIGNVSKIRVTIVLPDGRVVCDSHEDPGRMENHADRPEVISALGGLTGHSIRFSDTLREDFMYVAVPLRSGGGVAGAVRVSMPLTFIDESLRLMYMRIFIGGLAIAVLAALISLLLSRRISRPLEDIKKGAQRFAMNELSYRLPIYELDEFAELAEVMNDMAARLEDRIRIVTEQRNEQEAVFSSMVEGLLAVDTDERVMRLNAAASRFLEVDPADASGKTIQEVVRNPDLQEFVAMTLANGGTKEGDITLYRADGESYLQAHGTMLRDADGRKIGAVIVLNDVTRLRRLENLRRDFVANVSHELRTPITSIKGFVETLQDGAIGDASEAARFLGIIAGQAERMNSIIEDLLLLSRLDRDEEREKIRLEKTRLKALLLEAVRVCEEKAAGKDIRVEVDCPEELAAMVNPALIEQAVINLVDNAINYSEKGGPVTVSASAREGGVTIDVVDRGAGIAKEHIPRLFERFYRVDRARSRKLGGTGLGLAIVKHIVQAHDGRVTVESEPNEGSTFTIHLKQAV